MSEAGPFGCERLYSRYEDLEQVRRSGSAHWDDSRQSWLVTPYDDVTSLLTQSNLSAQRTHGYFSRIPIEVADELRGLQRFYSSWLMYNDPPKHTRLRRVVSRALTATVVNDLRPLIQRFAEELLENLASQRQMDLVHDYSKPLAIKTLVHLLGLPRDVYEQLDKWSLDLVGLLGTSETRIERGFAAHASLAELRSFLEPVIVARQQKPAADLVSLMLAKQNPAEPLGEAEIFGACANLLIDGHGPIASAITNGIVALQCFPQQLDRLRKADFLMESAVEEMLRFDPPFQYIARVAKEAMPVGDREIRPEQRILFMIAAANRDPQRFSEADKLAIERVGPPHCSFGIGAHYCPGAALARVTMILGIQTLLARIPQMTITGTVEPIPSYGYRGFASVPVAW